MDLRFLNRFILPNISNKWLAILNFGSFGAKLTNEPETKLNFYNNNLL